LEAAAHPSFSDPTSRSQAFLSISTLKENYAVIPKVTFSFIKTILGLKSTLLRLDFVLTKKPVAPTKL